ncbi:PAS domain-containing sensor histidine kinase [Halorubrum kocurii]|uniref:histidine kinase n=1 Tax=Halorubrum kocurii JCM 14978 TaxID=1230456 RepID=M0NWN1_9EURY|nr:PAS domain S-box protein [Halorubrum kocurii]EMA62362.1 PAS/PAC sensor protein [Halorubrum kocurii JCM 14978]
MAESPDPEVLLDLAGDKIAVLDEDGIFRHLNAAVTDLLGFRSDELVGTDALALVHPDEEARLRAILAEIVSGDPAPDEPLEYRYRTADAGWVWLRTTVHLPEETGIDGYVLTSRDITAEVESRRRLETIASVSGDVFWMFSSGWDELLFVNESVEEVFGVPADALERRPESFLDAVHPDDRPYVKRAMKRLSNGESTRIDYRLGPADGVTRWVRVPGEPVIENGEVVAVAGFARDVTEEYRRERQLAVMDNLLRHTIRNDMNIVDGTAERIADAVAEADAFDAEVGDGRIDPDALAELGAGLQEHAETIRRVASDLLTTAEKQRGVIDLLRQRGSPRTVEVAPVVEEALGMVVDDCDEAIDIGYREPMDDAGASEKGFGGGAETGAGSRFGAETETGARSADGGPVDETANGDSESSPRVSVSYPPNARAFTHPELDYAIAELVENAIEHAESTPRVRIDVRATDEVIEVSIHDNCPPIPVEERYVITDRWEMDDLRHTGGMGLWLVYWVANRSGGDLNFDTHGDGNIVTLTVPNAKTDASVEGSREPGRSNRSETGGVERADTRIRTDGSVPSAPDGGEDDDTDGAN